MHKKLKDKGIDILADAILSLDSKEECLALLEDLCTISEIKAMAQRLEVARMLEDRVIYSDIVRKTGASTATISRVNRALNYGAGGYESVLEKLDKNKREEK